MRKGETIVIIGAGGHGRVSADIARKLGYKTILFLDDSPLPGVAGKVSEYERYLDHAVFFVAIGNGLVREKLVNALQNKDAKLVSLIHPSAIIADNVTIGKGTVVMAGAVINTDTQIGDGVIINTCASVDHDCRIGNYVHIAVGAHVCGTVNIEANTWVGAGATLINNINVCASCMIGAGAVVIRDAEVTGTYVGVPAERVK